jgi:hypothetical protein
MRAKALGPLLGAAAVAALLIPGAAGAKPTGTHPADRQTPPETTEQFEVQGTNGFSVAVSLGNRRRLDISATAITPGKGDRSAIYDLPAPQAAGSDDIKARIGNLGRIDVRFVPEGVRKTAQLPPGCSGGRTTIEKGHFVGQISFRGEQGYTEVDAGRAAGTVTEEPSLTCKQTQSSDQQERVAAKEEAEAEKEAGIEAVELTAVVGHRAIAFDAGRVHGEEVGQNLTFTTFVAAASRNLGPIKEISSAISLAKNGAGFLSPDPLHPTAEAVIAPPFPFSGSATFKRASPQSASWSGDLKVELPGFGNVPLAGKGSRAALCEAPGCAG